MNNMSKNINSKNEKTMHTTTLDSLFVDTESIYFKNIVSTQADYVCRNNYKTKILHSRWDTDLLLRTRTKI